MYCCCSSQVYTLAEQLKYFDPVYERMMYEADNSEDGVVTGSTNAAVIEDQPWLQELAASLQQNAVSVIYKYISV